MDFCPFSRSHGKLIFQGKVMEFYTNCQFCARCMAMAVRAPASPKKARAIFVANWGPLGAKLKRK